MIEINGKSYPVRFSYSAIRSFLMKTGLALSDLSNVDKLILHLPILIYAGMDSGAKKAKEKLTMTLEQIEDWIDDDMSNIEKALAAFTDSQPKLDESGE